MSTRALYTFTDEQSSWNVYKHHDGYAKGAATTLRATLDYFTWQLPRFEADTFAAGFCAAGKASSMIDAVENDAARKAFVEEYGPTGKYRWINGGGVRLMPQGDPKKVAQENCSDIEYRYELFMKKNTLHIRCFSVSAWTEYSEKRLFSGTFEAFEKWVAKKEVVA